MRMKTMYGRLMSALTMMVMLFALLVSVASLPTLAAATTVSKSFTTHSTASEPLLVFGGETFTFTVSGTFVGTVKLQKSFNGADFADLTPAISTGAAFDRTLPAGAALGRLVYYRVYASTHTSGTIVTTLADVNDTVQVIKNLKGVDVVTIKDDGLAGSSLADSAVVTAKLSADAVIASKILDGAILTTKLSTDAVIASKIADGAVVTAKLASQSVITAKIYLDLPTGYLTCVTTSKKPGYCSQLNAATGVCNNCN